MATAAGMKLKLEHFDVTNAFTQSEIDNEIYVKPPDGYINDACVPKGKVLKLKKSLYGTKQASRLWQLKLRSFLVNDLKFKNSTHDPCLFSYHDSHGKIMLIGVYVDDIIVAHNDSKLLAWFTKRFTGEGGFKAKHLGSLSWFLGMAIDVHSDHSISISQEQYVDKLMEKFAPKNAPKHSMPCNPLTFHLLTVAQSKEEREEAKKLPYLQIIGSLLYISTMTRPDISYHMSHLCSLMHDPSPAAYQAAVELLLYVGNTKDYRITFNRKTTVPASYKAPSQDYLKKNCGIVCYSDSSWHKPDETGHSMFGYTIFMFGGPISFIARRLKVVATSTAEAEYAAAAATCKEIQDQAEIHFCSLRSISDEYRI